MSRENFSRRAVLAGVAAALPATAVVAAPSMGITPDTPVSFPGLVARLVRVRERWCGQRAQDRAWTTKIDELVYKASGVTPQQYRAMCAVDCADPRVLELDALAFKIMDELPDPDPVDEDGASIAWNEILDELMPLAAEIINQTPRSVADLAWQAEALVLANAELQQHANKPLGRHLRRLLANIRTLSGPLALPSALPTIATDALAGMAVRS